VAALAAAAAAAAAAAVRCGTQPLLLLVLLLWLLLLCVLAGCVLRRPAARAAAGNTAQACRVLQSFPPASAPPCWLCTVCRKPADTRARDDSRRCRRASPRQSCLTAGERAASSAPVRPLACAQRHAAGQHWRLSREELRHTRARRCDVSSASAPPARASAAAGAVVAGGGRGRRCVMHVRSAGVLHCHIHTQ
jgi:hypothetical protein